MYPLPPSMVCKTFWTATTTAIDEDKVNSEKKRLAAFSRLTFHQRQSLATTFDGIERVTTEGIAIMTTDIGAHEHKKFHPSSQQQSSSSRKLFCFVIIVIGITGICQFDLTFLYTTIGNSAETITKSSYFSSSGGILYDDSDEHKILQISVLGERNSGTRWTAKHLTTCFNASIPVKTKLTRYKHWFQYPGYYRYPHDTLVIAQFRNPYDWLKAMQHVPHHSPNHLQYRNDKYWKQFLSSTWTMERVGTDRWDNYSGGPCQDHFQYQDIISCAVEPLPRSQYGEKLHYSEHQPFYEMRNDGSGEPYANIMELRSDKILNMLAIKDYQGIADVWAVQYEYLLAKGTAGLIQQVEDWTGIKANCTPYEPQQRTFRPIEKDMADYIRDHLNWTVEAMIGYGPHADDDDAKSQKKESKKKKSRYFL